MHFFKAYNPVNKNFLSIIGVSFFSDGAMVNNKIKGKVAIVTGASSGVGWETARLLAERGARVVLAARSVQPLERLEKLIRDLGGEALAVTTDVTQPDQVSHLVQAALSQWGQIDILVANAGQYVRSPIASLSPGVMEGSLAVNFYGGLYPILDVLPSMLARKSGHIVLNLTMDVKTPLPGDAPYVAAKSALSGLGDVLRQELHGSGIQVTEVYAGRIDTPMVAHMRFPSISAKMPPQQVARAILKSIERRPAEIILPAQANLLNIIHFISPSLAGWAARVFNLQGWID
jgi:NADP-dependent 3-hydroxy acid dehydrogenase YdfG